jgi:hypothetical protein
MIEPAAQFRDATRYRAAPRRPRAGGRAWAPRKAGVARRAWSGQARRGRFGPAPLDGAGPVRTFAPLAGVPGVRFVSLQFGAAAEAAQPPPGMDLFDPIGGNDGFRRHCGAGG